MEITQLRYFKRVAEVGNVTRAGRDLGISQPSLSIAIKKLESELSTVLFHRDRKGVVPTATGLELLEYARRILDLVREAEQSVRGLEADDVGQLRIGCPDVLGAYFLPAFLRQFIAERPGIELTFWNGPSPAVHQAVLTREVEFGIAVNPLSHPDLVMLDLFDDATDVMVPSSRVASSWCEAESTLRTGPLSYAANLPQSQSLLEELGSRDLLPARRLPCGDLEMVKSLLLGDVGVAILPRRVAGYAQPGRLSRLHPDCPFIADSIRLIYRGDLHRTRAAMKVKDALVAHGASLRPI